MPFTPEERMVVKFHLGYPLQQTDASIAFGIPISTQPMFLVERALGLLPDPAVNMCRGIVLKLDDLLEKLTDGQDHLAADQLEELTLRKDYLPRLRDEYAYWQSRLAQILGCPVNPDFSGIGDVDMTVRNIPVSG